MYLTGCTSPSVGPCLGLYSTDSPSGNCWSWFLSTDSSCREGAQESHPGRRPPRLLPMQRDKCVMLLLSSHRARSPPRGRPRVTAGSRLWERWSSLIEAGMCRGTRTRPAEEQLNRPVWQLHTSGHAGERQRCPEDSRSSAATRKGPHHTAITPALTGGINSDLSSVCTVSGPNAYWYYW